jgi:EF hand
MKTKHTVFTTLLFIFMASGSGVVSAADSSVPTTSASFEQLDANKDGQVSADEAGNNIELIRMWSSVDTDKNGAIDRTEFSAFESLRAEPEESGEAPSEDSSGPL